MAEFVSGCGRAACRHVFGRSGRRLRQLDEHGSLDRPELIRRHERARPGTGEGGGDEPDDHVRTLLAVMPPEGHDTGGRLEQGVPVAHDGAKRVDRSGIARRAHEERQGEARLRMGRQPGIRRHLGRGGQDGKGYHQQPPDHRAEASRPPGDCTAHTVDHATRRLVIGNSADDSVAVPVLRVGKVRMPVEEEGMSRQMGEWLAARLRADIAARVVLVVNVTGSVRSVAVPP